MIFLKKQALSGWNISCSRRCSFSRKVVFSNMLSQAISILVQLHTNAACKWPCILTMQIAFMSTEVISTSESLLAQCATIFRGNTGSIGTPELVDDVLF